MNDQNDELVKCQILAKMKDDTFIVYIEKFAEKRLVPWTHLRPLHASSPLSRDFFPMPNNRIYGGIGQPFSYRCGYNLHGNTKAHTKRQRIGNFTTGFSYNRDAICNSDFDFEPYINLSNFSLNASHAQRELIAYPMVYSQSGNMNSNNSNSNPSNGGNSKSMKNRQQNNAQHQANDGENKVVTVLKNDTDNGNGNANGGGGGAGSQQYGKNGNESKNDSQSSNTSSSSTAGHQQSYHQQQQMAEPNVIVNASGGMPATVSHQPVSNYYQPGPVATAPAPVYYYQAGDDQNGVYAPSDMMVPHGVYAIPAAPAYQSTAATTAMPPGMQPGMYAPAAQTTHYPIPVNGWPAYTQPMNPQGNT